MRAPTRRLELHRTRRVAKRHVTTGRLLLVTLAEVIIQSDEIVNAWHRSGVLFEPLYLAYGQSDPAEFAKVLLVSVDELLRAVSPVDPLAPVSGLQQTMANLLDHDEAREAAAMVVTAYVGRDSSSGAVPADVLAVCDEAINASGFSPFVVALYWELTLLLADDRSRCDLVLNSDWH